MSVHEETQEPSSIQTILTLPQHSTTSKASFSSLFLFLQLFY
jgi:hypothetical protein